MKFTEEQYQKIVETSDKAFKEWNFGLLNSNAICDFRGMFEKMHFNLIEDWDKISALANPLTREWAHDKFVEKEKEFYWTSKKQDINGDFARLYKCGSEMISNYSMMKPKNNINSDEQLTESEIKAWGYNPEMFDREEV
ncbi:hypothetical protein JK162_01720 [Leuconostoc pseudomesenteroides]|uniref:hypothetical protein n=1 Tax=Leuconostoc pseudomesenteroides TaxID=33968 RepID=UPI001B8AEF47|nr:hypothetical protein [Leuconostoc pseudomesenteroides]MBS0957219.1 hypothetical protein [Leuconostoc pseudomesenteroides]